MDVIAAIFQIPHRGLSLVMVTQISPRLYVAMLVISNIKVSFKKICTFFTTGVYVTAQFHNRLNIASILLTNFVAPAPAGTWPYSQQPPLVPVLSQLDPIYTSLPPKPYIISSPLPCVPHALPTSLSLI
jgi:hypothetical protein